MTLKNIRASCVSVSLGSVAVGATLLWQAVAAQTVRSVADGVFTTAQASRGKTQYEMYCESCHGTNLEGGGEFNNEPAPRLKRPNFVKGRGDLGGLFKFLKDKMPADAPSTLRDATYTDILAYLLQQNEYPTGSEELKPDPDFLKAIRVASEK